MWTLAGFVHVAFVVDVFSRRILGWRVATTRHMTLVLDALRQAMHTRHSTEYRWGPQIDPSLRRRQYTSLAFTTELIAAGIAASIGTVGDALARHALMESTIGLCKAEAIHTKDTTWRDRREVEWQIAAWVHWYKQDRLRSSIHDLPPLEFEQHHRHVRGPRDVLRPFDRHRRGRVRLRGRRRSPGALLGWAPRSCPLTSPRPSDSISILYGD